MSTKPRVIIITGNSKRHEYYVECLERELDVVQVYAETKFSYVDAFADSSFADEVKGHFQLRDESEQFYFGSASPKSPIKTLERGEANKPEVVEEIIGLNADFVLLFGSGIIKEPILEVYKDRVINMHLGLSPYYRGSGTNFWPLVDGKPECVGATIHLAVLKVDAGGILHQVRPMDLSEEDTIHDLGNKTIRSTLSVLPKVIKDFSEGKISPSVQDNKDDRDYRRMDLNKEAIVSVYSNFDKGMISSYLLAKSSRDEKYPIVEAL
ncbi:MAG: hypothetical protein NXI09_12375 [Bacteroidetes bacterium]|nr:hypothetical protein [Bacteroidota bacterium]